MRELNKKQTLKLEDMTEYKDIKDIPEQGIRIEAYDISPNALKILTDKYPYLYISYDRCIIENFHDILNIIDTEQTNSNIKVFLRYRLAPYNHLEYKIEKED